MDSPPSAMKSKIFRDDQLHQDYQNSITDFTLKMYQRLIQISTDGNLFYSPFSISAAMSMVYLGARKRTAAQMVKPLSIQSLGHRVHEAYEDYLKVVMAKNENITLHIANRLFPNKKATIVPSFVTHCAIHYQAEAEGKNYDDSETAREEINEWVSQQTADKIKDLLPGGSLNPLTMMVLVNAIYFKGDWETKFDDKVTRDMAFHNLKGEQKTVKMMFQKASRFLLKRDDELKCEVLELPYKGNSLSMIIILLDDKDGLPALEEKLTPSKLQGLFMNMLSDTKVNVYLPKFKLKSGFELSELFQQMGMTDLFNGNADLSGIDESRMMYVSGIFHQAFVDVNEEGTEAAAATAVVMMTNSFSPTSQFKADHPFMFVIKDSRSDTILFVGRFVDVDPQR